MEGHTVITKTRGNITVTAEYLERKGDDDYYGMTVEVGGKEVDPYVHFTYNREDAVRTIDYLLEHHSNIRYD